MKLITAFCSFMLGYFFCILGWYLGRDVESHLTPIGQYLVGGIICVIVASGVGLMFYGLDTLIPLTFCEDKDDA